MVKNNKKKGFTIVELVIVIAVIAILAAVLIPTFSNVVKKAQKNAALQDAKNALTTYIAQQLDSDPAFDIASIDGTIQSGAYYFTVADGQLTTTAEESGTATLKVENGTLVDAS